MSGTLLEALREAYAVSRATRCTKHLFSLSLSPPEYADVSIEDFEAAIDEIEKRLGLVDQPRIIVFHEKYGRRHCHTVWSRIHAEKLIAVHMSHFKYKLMEVSRHLYLKHGWKMPKGMEKGQKRESLHLSREEHRQAVRLSEDPQALKAMFKETWERSDSKATYTRALEEQGFLLARGDKRGYVAIDVKGGVYSLTRWLGVSTRDLKARLGPPEELPPIEKAKGYLASRMTENLNRFIGEAKSTAAARRLPLVQEIRTLTAQHRAERHDLLAVQQTRWQDETRQRAARLRTGVAGIWQRVTGDYAKVRLLNEAETKAGLQRDRKELQSVIRNQLVLRQDLQQSVVFYREEHRAEVFRLRQEIARYVKTATEPVLPQLPATAAGGAVAEKLPLAAQLAQVETRIALLSGDLSLLQASLESNLLSDEMRARIRRVIEKALETLQLKVIETKTEEQKAQEKTREYQAKQAEVNQLIQRYAELQLKVEAETRTQEANRAFLEIVTNMSYSLNGVPRWAVFVMSPPEDKRLDEREYVQKVVLKRDTSQLIERVFNSPENESQVSKRPPIDPKTAVPALRQNVLEVKEMLLRANIKPPSGGGTNRVAPATIRMTSAPPLGAAIKFNAAKR
ncbi:MAG: hypothetical protein PSY14_15905 [bacterium]|nr:hypothetical protein [bacterium]